MQLSIYRKDNKGLITRSVEEWESKQQFIDYFNLPKQPVFGFLLGHTESAAEWHGNVGFGISII